MAAIVWNDVVALPGADVELATVSVAGQTILLAVANSILDVNMFDGESGPITKAARCFLCAHFAALGKLGSGGPLIGESDGRLSRQYAMPNSRAEALQTSYGSAYWQLICGQARGPRVL